MVDDENAADVVHQFGDGGDVGQRPEGARCGGDGDQPGVGGEDLLPLPDRQLTGLDVDLGPLDPGAVPVRGPDPRRDVGLVVEPTDHHLIAQPGAPGRGVGKCGQQYRTIRAENHTRGIGVEQVGDCLPRGVENGDTAPCSRMRGGGVAGGVAEGRRHRAGDRLRHQHSGGCVESDPAVAQTGMQSAHPGDVECHDAPLLRRSPAALAARPAATPRPTTRSASPY